MLTSIVANFPSEAHNYSTPTLSLCLRIQSTYVSRCSREGRWSWSAGAGVVPAPQQHLLERGLLLSNAAVVQREVTLSGTLSFLLVLVIALVTHQSGSQSKSRFTLYRVWQLADDCFPSVNQTFIYLV